MRVHPAPSCETTRFNYRTSIVWRAATFASASPHEGQRALAVAANALAPTFELFDAALDLLAAPLLAPLAHLGAVLTLQCGDRVEFLGLRGRQFGADLRMEGVAAGLHLGGTRRYLSLPFGAEGFALHSGGTRAVLGLVGAAGVALGAEGCPFCLHQRIDAGFLGVAEVERHGEHVEAVFAVRLGTLRAFRARGLLRRRRQRERESGQGGHGDPAGRFHREHKVV